nr:O-antigen ligase family protein [Candidatus Electrothrix aestuarii]
MNNAAEAPMSDIRTDYALAEPAVPSKSKSARWLVVFAFFILAAPKLRATVGPIPLYFHNILLSLLLIKATQMPRIKPLRPLAGLVSLYLFFIYLGELHAILIYGSVFEPIYMMGEFTLSLALFFLVPRVVKDTESVAMVLKALTAGMLCASAVTIMYSLPFTRPFVMKTILSYDFLVPAAESLARRTLQLAGVDGAARGYSLLGVSTFTTGVLGIAWGYSFLAAKWPGIYGKWKMLAQLASIVTPVAILMTYGRAAWLTVIVISGIALFFGFAGSRRNTLLMLTGLAITVSWVGWDSEALMVSRVVNKTNQALENPSEESNLNIRILSYTQPLSHLSDNPLWLFFGTGRSGSKMRSHGDIGAELRDLAGLSKHSAFAMAYYNYGLFAAILHVFLMLTGLRFILSRLKKSPPTGVHYYKITWQAFLLNWIGLLMWWLPGHAVVSDTRGSMHMFLFYGLMMACDRIFTEQTDEENP